MLQSAVLVLLFAALAALAALAARRTGRWSQRARSAANCFEDAPVDAVEC